MKDFRREKYKGKLRNLSYFLEQYLFESLEEMEGKEELL